MKVWVACGVVAASLVQVVILPHAAAQSENVSPWEPVVQAQIPAGDFDVDDDGLIEVSLLAQLNAVRWDLDGDGSVDRSSFGAGYTAAFPEAVSGMGCPASGCLGYELVADLDFDTDSSSGSSVGDRFWNDGLGWVPIGTSINKFDAFFVGNDRIVSNLYVNRKIDNVGLFGYLGGSANVCGVRLVDADVETKGRFVGALVGRNLGGTVCYSSVTGSVTGYRGVGGRIGSNLGGPVFGSYSQASVSGRENLGGLVGSNSVGGSVEASYARGAVTGYEGVGGLVGWHSGSGLVRASYARGPVAGSIDVGGLIGRKDTAGSVSFSYWDTETSKQGHSAGGTGYTTSALTAPTGYNGIYQSWNTDLGFMTGPNGAWDFGTTTQYPALRNLDEAQIPAGDFDVDDDGLIEVSLLAQLNAVRWDLDGDGSVDRSSFGAGYTAAFPEAVSGMGCPASGCLGYELVADLDFDTDSSSGSSVGDRFWNDGLGWVPIGTSINKFDAFFVGNDRIVLNLYVNRKIDNVGLFGYLGGSANVCGVRLVDADVETKGRFVGALVGRNLGGTVCYSSVTGSVTGYRGVGG